MRTSALFAFSLFVLLQAAAASAQTYQWKDSSGRTVISDTPPPASAKGSRTVNDAAPAAGTAKTLADKDLEFKKRRQESQQKAEKEAKVQAAAADRKDNCERGQRQLATLESGERLVTRDAQGEKRYLEDAERQQEIERTRRLVADLCK